MPWINHEKYAEIMGQPVKYIVKLCSDKAEAKKYPKIIDSRDKKQFSSRKYSIFYEPHDASGSNFPRLVDRVGA